MYVELQYVDYQLMSQILHISQPKKSRPWGGHVTQEHPVLKSMESKVTTRPMPQWHRFPSFNFLALVFQGFLATIAQRLDFP